MRADGFCVPGCDADSVALGTPPQRPSTVSSPTTSEQGAAVVSHGWQSSLGIVGLGSGHEPHSQRIASDRGDDTGGCLPGVRRVASLAKRWMLDPHQGRSDEAHLQSYVNEFVVLFSLSTPPVLAPSFPGPASSPSATIRCVTGTPRQLHVEEGATVTATQARAPAEPRSGAGGPAVADSARSRDRRVR